MSTMSPPRKAAMSASEFRRLLKAAGLNHSTGAVALGVNRRTIIRWAKGTTPIATANALLIRTILTPAK